MTSRRRGRLAAYARYQLGDYLLQRAALPSLIVLAMMAMGVYAASKTSEPGFWATASGEQMARMFFDQMMTLFLPLGAFLGISGLVSSDRLQGHYRFLFSKPVSPPAYYAQAFAVHLLAFAALAAALAALLGALTAPAPVFAAAEAAALTFILIGGIGLLCGSLVRFDGSLLVLTYLVSFVLQQFEAAQPGMLPWWASKAAQLLPPVYKLDHVRTRLFAAEAVVTADLWHVLGYGAGCAALGLLVVHKAPLSR